MTVFCILGRIMMKVKVKISSVIENLDSLGNVEGESEENEAKCFGQYSYSEGEATLSYTERSDGGEVSSLITVSGDTVTVKRLGAISSELKFKEGESYSSIYSIPPYSFDATVRARKIRISLDTEGGSVDLFYNMKIGGAEKSARMRIWISPCSSKI